MYNLSKLYELHGSLLSPVSPTYLGITACREDFILTFRFRRGAAEALADRRQPTRAQADFRVQMIRLDRIRGTTGHVSLTKS